MPAIEREMKSSESVEAIEQLILGEGKSLCIEIQLSEVGNVAL
jgi:hypothetical protein